MKILMLTDYFYPHIGGGVEKVVCEISKRLVGRGCDVTIVTLNTDKAEDFDRLGNLKIHRIESIPLIRAIGAQLTISLHAPFRILNICKRENPDIIHANNRFFFTTMCVATLKRMLKKPLITTLHKSRAFGKAWLNFAVKTYETTVTKLIIRKSDRIIAVSNAVKRDAVCLGAASEKITVIPNGVDLYKFKPRKKHANNPKQNSIKRVIFVGRLIPNKGIQYLIDAAPRILSQRQNVNFLIVGDGPSKEELRARAQRREVLNSFKFLGLISDVEEILRKCDIFVLPSLTEGMPLTVLEAMASGLPVVATNVGGVPEIVIDDVTGILVEPGDVQELADSIIQLLSDYDLSRRLRNNAFLLTKKFNWEEIVESTLKVYKECLGEKVVL